MNDTECPYCGKDVEICTDDGYGCAEDEIYEQQCGNCDKNFTFTISYSVTYYPEKAPCLNGERHKYKATCTYPKRYTKMRCADCGTERKPTDLEWLAINE